MTKREFLQAAISGGWSCNYDGKTKTMYVCTQNDMSKEDIEIAVAQHFGVMPDFKLEKN